jgi:hypothetical protein
MGVREAALQYFVDCQAEIFGRRYALPEFGQCIEVHMFVARQDFARHETVQDRQIADHARARIHRTADRDFQRVVMTVAVRIVALAVGGAVLLGRHFLAVQPVRSGKPVSPGEVCFH